MKYGRLTVIGPAERKEHVHCICDCGKEKIVNIYKLRRGDTKSCGCYRTELNKKKYTILGMAKKTHGASKSRTYHTWQAMKNRCRNKNLPCFKDYGGRGIKVCDRWLNSFETFLADMGEAPENHSIERIDNDKDYCPDNCKWATHTEQQRNKRTSRNLTYKGVTMTAAEWARKLSLDRQTICDRFEKGWPIERVLSPERFHSHDEAVASLQGFYEQRRGRTHCKHGHEYTPENTYRAKDNSRVCKICVRNSQNRRKKV